MTQQQFLDKFDELLDEYLGDNSDFEDINEGYNREYRDSDHYFCVSLDINRYAKPDDNDSDD